MLQPYEYCPKCKETRKMEVSLSVQKLSDTRSDPDGGLLLSYHCSICRTFVRHVPIHAAEEEKLTWQIVGPPGKRRL